MMHSRSFDIDDNSDSGNRYNNSNYHNCKQSSEKPLSENNDGVFDLQDRKILYKVLNVTPQATPR